MSGLFSHWSDDEHRKFIEQMAEMTRTMNLSIREQIAGTIDAHPELRDQFASHGLINYEGILYGTLISPATASELVAIRREAILLSAEDRGATGDEVWALMERIIPVLGKVFVRVEPPHRAIGEKAVRKMPLVLLFPLFNLAYTRRDSDDDD
jgi:hypothetical protein